MIAVWKGDFAQGLFVNVKLKRGGWNVNSFWGRLDLREKCDVWERKNEEREI